MKICFVADGRSPITQQWVNYFPLAGHEVHLVSTFPCEPGAMPGVKVTQLPLAFAWAAGTKDASGPNGKAGHRLRDDSPSLFRRAVSLISRRANLGDLWVKWVAPLSAAHLRTAVRRHMESLQPDLVHALRIPFEAELAALARCSPLIVSAWGNDFTLFAEHSFLHKTLTRLVMKRAEAFTSDCQRDIRLAHQWGLPMDRPTAVFLGNGGVRLDLFNPNADCRALRQELRIPAGAPVILNARGFRSYVRNDCFFAAIPVILKRVPGAVFVCAGMLPQRQAWEYVEKYGIESSVRLLAPLPHDRMAGLFRLADVMVSPATHDGTPNTLVEGMACGAFPACGDLESIREWVEDGRNGKLFDPNDPSSLSQAVVAALGDADLRRRAADINWNLIRERADYTRIMPRVEAFYRLVLSACNAAR